MIIPLHTSILVFRSQETPIDGQPPALPPKQFKKNSWNQIHHSHSQQELDNHINETFDVPASPEKSTVSFWIQFNYSAFYQSSFSWAWFWCISESCCVCAWHCSVSIMCTVSLLAPSIFSICWSSPLSSNDYVGMDTQIFWTLTFQHMQKFLTNLFFERSFIISFKEDLVNTTSGV